ncbi:MAG: hypothetical protein QOF84_3228 [Streptomyces sp.]|nr:hypothetical protein [Streptomyces sp.]
MNVVWRFARSSRPPEVRLSRSVMIRTVTRVVTTLRWCFSAVNAASTAQFAKFVLGGFRYEETAWNSSSRC